MLWDNITVSISYRRASSLVFRSKVVILVIFLAHTDIIGLLLLFNIPQLLLFLIYLVLENGFILSSPLLILILVLIVLIVTTIAMLLTAYWWPSKVLLLIKIRAIWAEFIVTTGKTFAILLPQYSKPVVSVLMYAHNVYYRGAIWWLAFLCTPHSFVTGPARARPTTLLNIMKRSSCLTKSKLIEVFFVESTPALTLRNTSKRVLNWFNRSW